MIRCLGCMAELENGTKICPHCGYQRDMKVKESYYLPAGTMIQNRYLVGKVIGAGGFGIVSFRLCTADLLSGIQRNGNADRKIRPGHIKDHPHNEPGKNCRNR